VSKKQRRSLEHDGEEAGGAQLSYGGRKGGEIVPFIGRGEGERYLGESM
jgi:hypothetical protein